MKTFEELGVSAPIRRAIEELGFVSPMPVQEAVIPFLVDLGYDRQWTAGMVSVGGGLGVIIPPSIPFIMFAMASGASVSDLFLAGIVPGVLIGVLLMAYAYVYCKRHGEDRERIDSRINELHEKGFFAGVDETMERRVRNVKVGKILKLEKHPNSDHMLVCQIDVGADAPVQICTGAWNVHEGDLVPAALHNALLPNGNYLVSMTCPMPGVTTDMINWWF